jgi:hypothetical protein
MTPAQKDTQPKEPLKGRNLTIIKLSKPVNWGDQEITELGLDLESLTGDDWAEAEHLSSRP